MSRRLQFLATLKFIKYKVIFANNKKISSSNKQGFRDLGLSVKKFKQQMQPKNVQVKLSFLHLPNPLYI